MKREKKQKYPIHRMGKHCRYEEFEDGSIQIAPTYVERIQRVIVEKSAVEYLVKTVLEQCKTLLVPIEEAEKDFWRSIVYDYSLDEEKYIYTYIPSNTRVIRRLKEE